MAEFLNQTVEPEMYGLNALGKPVLEDRMDTAYKTCKAMGVSTPRAFECVSAMAEAIKRDNPYGAMEAGMKFVDLTGTYRLLAVLMAS